MSREQDIGAALGRFVEGIGLANLVRGHYAAKHGRCRRCDAPLGGPSPTQTCGACHADELLAKAGGNGGGEV